MMINDTWAAQKGGKKGGKSNDAQLIPALAPTESCGLAKLSVTN